MEEVATRISQLITAQNLSHSEFADSIDLPRPILSHILSGRNKPSLLVVQKILDHYPEVNAGWLLLGKGDMKTNPQSSQTVSLPEIEKTTTPVITPSLPKQKETPIPSHSNSKPNTPNTGIESIVHYYSDGTFVVYLPK